MVIWQADLSAEEELRADDETIDEMYNRLEKFWQELKDELLHA